MEKTKQILPKEAYFQKEWFEKEKTNIFEKEWQFVCMIEDLEKNNSYVLEDIGNTPIIVLNKDSSIKAFVNMCRHRGMRLLRGDEKLDSSIICPYHNWNYNLEGKLKGVPQSKEFEDLDKSCMGLKELLCEVWNGLVFVNLNKNAKSLKDTLEPLKNRILPYDNIKELRANDGYRYIINANWKVFVENYMDVYHLFHIHKESLKEYDHKNSKNEFVDKQWLFYQPLTKKGNSSSFWWDVAMGKIPSFNGDRGAYVSMLFPNFGITATENLCLFIHIKPISEEETEVVVYSKSYYETRVIKMPIVYNYKDGKNKKELLKKADVMNEDIYACEMIQKNIKSSFFEVSALAQNLEKPLYLYQSFIKESMS